jgi:hypothetical protein
LWLQVVKGTSLPAVGIVVMDRNSNAYQVIPGDEAPRH